MNVKNFYDSFTHIRLETSRIFTKDTNCQERLSILSSLPSQSNCRNIQIVLSPLMRKNNSGDELQNEHN